MTAASGFTPQADQLERVLRDGSAADAVLLAQQYLRAGLLESALRVCELAGPLDRSGPALGVCEATALFGLGERARAFARVQEVLRASPDHPGARQLVAAMFGAAGRPGDAVALLDGLVRDFPDHPGALPLLASLRLPGPSYREVLARIHRLLRPDTYLEIGVETGATLALAVTATTAAGVDPAECPNARSLPPSARLYRMESDAFFARESVATVFGGRPVDLAFIDGMHWFEYALRDFVNVERWCGPGSTVVIHDCLPVAAVAAARERASTFWVGDVWKVLDVLVEHRPDLRVSVVPTAPSGLVVVRGLDPRSTILSSRMEELIARRREAPYPHDPGRWPDLYRVVSNDDAGVQAALAP